MSTPRGGKKGKKRDVDQTKESSSPKKADAAKAKRAGGQSPSPSEKDKDAIAGKRYDIQIVECDASILLIGQGVCHHPRMRRLHVDTNPCHHPEQETVKTLLACGLCRHLLLQIHPLYFVNSRMGNSMFSRKQSKPVWPNASMRYL